MLKLFRKIFKRKSRVISLNKGGSYRADDSHLIISHNGIWHIPNTKGSPYRDEKSETVDLVIGAPGLLNKKASLQLNDAVLYQLPNFGVVEIRVVRMGFPVKILITEVSPQRGFSIDYSVKDHENAAFASDESTIISQALHKVTNQMADRDDITPQQFELLKEKLTEVGEASRRLGRKDWIMFAAGTLGNLATGAMLPPEAIQALFKALNSELSWVFQNALRISAN